MYDDLKMPWQIEPPVTAFDEKDSKRYEWNRDGKVEQDEDFFQELKMSPHRYEQAMSTASMVTRWREDHPDLVGTDLDCVKQTVQRLKEAIGGDFEIKFGTGFVLLLFKKGPQ